MKSYEEHMKNYPPHIADQAEAADEQSRQLMQDFVEFSATVGHPKEHTEGKEAIEKVMAVIQRFVNQPSFCEHLAKSPNQLGWWFLGLDRSEIKCTDCLGVAMSDREIVQTALSDPRCEICQVESSHFHADAVRFGAAIADGIVAVSAFFEACPDCHEEAGMPTA